MEEIPSNHTCIRLFYATSTILATITFAMSKSCYHGYNKENPTYLGVELAVSNIRLDSAGSRLLRLNVAWVGHLPRPPGIEK